MDVLESLRPAHLPALDEPSVVSPHPTRQRKRGARWSAFCVLALWLLVACLSASRHELWRDDVHAISLVEHARSPVEIPARIAGEGHPVLWFAVLELARRVRGGSRGLPWLSVAIGAVAVWFFLWKSPFPLWFKALFMPRSVCWRQLMTLIGAWHAHGFAMFSVIEKESRRWIGRVGPWQPDGWPGTEIGWAISRDRWGQGYAGESAAAAADWAFATLGWSRMLGSTTRGSGLSGSFSEYSTSFTLAHCGPSAAGSKT